jgi:hypothetical protein
LLDDEVSLEETAKSSTLERKDAAALFLVWNVLLLPWIVIAPFLGMVFDAPPTFSIYVGVWSVWTYPLSVGIVWMFRKKHPLITLFPCINLVAFLIASHVP